MNNEIKRMVKAWVQKLGEHQVMSRLTARRLSSSFVSQLIKGTYEHEVKGANLTILLDEMALDGFTLEDEEAS